MTPWAMVGGEITEKFAVNEAFAPIDALLVGPTFRTVTNAFPENPSLTQRKKKGFTGGASSRFFATLTFAWIVTGDLAGCLWHDHQGC